MDQRADESAKQGLPVSFSRVMQVWTGQARRSNVDAEVQLLPYRLDGQTMNSCRSIG